MHSCRSPRSFLLSVASLARLWLLLSLSARNPRRSFTDRSRIRGSTWLSCCGSVARGPVGLPDAVTIAKLLKVYSATCLKKFPPGIFPFSLSPSPFLCPLPFSSSLFHHWEKKKKDRQGIEKGWVVKLRAITIPSSRLQRDSNSRGGILPSRGTRTRGVMSSIPSNMATPRTRISSRVTSRDTSRDHRHHHSSLASMNRRRTTRLCMASTRHSRLRSPSIMISGRVFWYGT